MNLFKQYSEALAKIGNTIYFDYLNDFIVLNKQYELYVSIKSHQIFHLVP